MIVIASFKNNCGKFCKWHVLHFCNNLNTHYYSTYYVFQDVHHSRNSRGKFIVLTFLANKNLPDKRRDVSCIAMLVVGIPYLYLWARFAIQHIKCSGKPIKTHESSLHTPKELSVSVNATSKIVCCRKHCFETHDITHSWGWRTSCFNGTQSG